MMPTAFLSHGAPDRVLTDSPSHRFLQSFSTLVKKPKGILIISAHWQTQELTLSAPGELETVHDFFGFPKALHQFQYPAFQSKSFTHTLVTLFEEAGLSVRQKNRGLDHGSWSVLALAYPESEIPIANLSLPHYESFSDYLELGRKLTELRQHGILIIGSGSATHNLGTLSLSRPTPTWATDFVGWLQSNVKTMNDNELAKLYQNAPNGKTAHPTPEHFLPLLVAMGAAEGGTSQLLHDSYELSSLNNSSFLFE